MKLTRYAILLIAAFALLTDVKAETIKIVALNIEWFPGQRSSADEEAMARHIENTKAALPALQSDILVATEICDEAAFREVLTVLPGMDIKVMSNFADRDPESGRRNQQIVIASHLPVIAGWTEPWVATYEDLRRGFAFAVLENPRTGRLILIYGLHLKSNLSFTEEDALTNFAIRDDSIRQLLDHQKAMEEQYGERGIEGWIIAGDINTNHDGQFGDRVVETLVEAGYWNTWQNIPADERETWKGRPGRFAPSSLDYIFLKGFGTPDATLYVVDDNVSDHNAVAVTIELPGE